jgi:hypothetical protein
MENKNKSRLSPPRASLVKFMQRLNFGRIVGLVVLEGEPVLEPLPHLIREIKFGGENGPHPKTSAKDFILKAPVCELFAQMEAMGNGVINCLEIKHGLPFRMTIEEDAA